MWVIGIRARGVHQATGLIGFVAALTCPGCIIGTWPTPEEHPQPGLRGREPVGPEDCGDEVDNDGDGSVDEGCDCGEAFARGCVGVEKGMCALGVQYCEQGEWRECDDFSPGYAPAQNPNIQVVSVTPDPLHRDSTPSAVVTVEATPPCAGFRLEVQVTLSASRPKMKVRASAQDDGLGEDAQPGDNRYTAQITLPYGPGVPAQTLSVEAESYVQSARITAGATVELEAP